MSSITVTANLTPLHPEHAWVLTYSKCMRVSCGSVTASGESFPSVGFSEYIADDCSQF
jgi:hypothetical protein